MKKFYTLIATAAVALSVSAAAPMANKAGFGVAKSQKVFEEKPVQELLKDMNMPSVHGFAQQTRSHKAGISLGTPIENTIGEYACTDYSLVDNGNGEATGWEGPIINVIDLGDGENELDVYGFWLGTDQNGQFQNVVTGTYTKSESTLSFAAGTHVATVATSTGNVDVYMYIMDMTSYTLLNDPIEFKYTASDHCFSYVGTDNGTSWTSCLFFTSEAHAGGTQTQRGFDFQVINNMNLYNGVYSYSLLKSDDTEDPYVDPVYAESFGNSILVYNMLDMGYGIGVEFTVDKAAGTATLDNQYMELETSTGTKQYIFCSIEGQQAVPTVPFQGSTELKGTGADAYYVTTLTNDDYLFITTDGYGFETVKSTMQLFDMNVFGESAIQNVSADFDMNAPVEYFNLQGVRVDNPTNGLYIIRQGNKTAKVIR